MREYLLVLLVAAGTTWLLTPLARALALRLGAMTEVRDRDVHVIPTPRLGGLALLGGVGAALLVASRLPVLRTTFESTEVVAVAAGAVLVCLLGAVDDVVGLDAVTKLAGQTAAAGVMVLLGLQLLWVVVPGGGVLVLSSDVAVPLTVLVTLLAVNAINFVDGLDGLAAGVTAIAALAFFAYSYDLSVVEGVSRADSATLISAVVAGACLGFLPHNHSPARVFMGDSGAMLLGLLLAATTISATGRVGTTDLAGGQTVPFLLPVLLPLAVLAVPVLDLLLAVVRRLRAGRSPFAPDRQHLHHRLLDVGHTHARAVWVLWAWTSVLAFGGVALAVSRTPARVLAVGGVVAASAVLAALFALGPRLRGPRWRGARLRSRRP